MNKKIVGLSIVCIVILAIFVANAAISEPNVQSDVQGIPTAQVSTVKYKYSAKFVCGDGYTSSTNKWPIVAPAKYFTAVNLHNPQTTTFNITKRIVVALPEDQMYISPFRERTYPYFKPEYAFEMDCSDIYNLTDGKFKAPQFIKGFAIITSPKPLDVTTVYSSIGQNQDVTLDVETVNPKAIIPATSTIAADIPID